MAAAVTNDWTITYAGLTVGGTTDYLLRGPVKLSFRNSPDRTQRKVTLEATVVLADPVEAPFAASLAAVKLAFSTARQTLTVALGATTVLSGSFNAQAEARETGDDVSTGRSRAVEIRVEAELATTFPNGLSFVEFEVVKSPSGRRTVTFSGCYNAVTPNGSLAVYYANSYTFAATYLATLANSTLTGRAPEWVQTVDDPRHDTDDKVCEWRQVYEEVVYGEKPGTTLVDPEIVQIRLDVDRDETEETETPQGFSQDAPSSIPGFLQLPITVRPVTLVATYEAWLKVRTLQSKWSSAILPWIITTLGTFARGGLAVVEVKPTFDPVLNRITATVRALDFRATVVGLRVSVEDDEDYGVEIDSLLVGDPLAAEVSQLTATYTRTITKSSTTVGPVNLPSFPSPPAPASSGWVSRGRKRRTAQRRVGIPSTGRTQILTDTTDVEILRYVVRVSGGGTPGRQSTGSAGPSPVAAPSSVSSSSSSGAPDGPNASTPPAGS